MDLIASLLWGSSTQDKAAPQALVKAPSPKSSHSFERLQQLYDQLSQFRESDLERGSGEKVVEAVREITEALIWGEQNDSNCFDFFCEKNILSDFIRVLGLAKAPNQIKMQLLQSVSILVQNIRKQTSLYYLLSSNHVNKLIEMRLDFMDEEILAYYITLLKSLAMRLDADTVRFFYVGVPVPTFSLYTEAVRFFGHRDQMVRANVRTITLQVYKVPDAAVRRFVLRHAEVYFERLAEHLCDIWARLDAAAARSDGTLGAGDVDGLGAVRHENELQQDVLCYVADILDLQVGNLNDILADRLLQRAMLPVLVASLAAHGRPEAKRRSQAGTPLVAPAVALFLLRQVLDTCRYPAIAERLARAVLGNGLANSALCQCLRDRDDSIFVLASGVIHSFACDRPSITSFAAGLRSTSPIKSSALNIEIPDVPSERPLVPAMAGVTCTPGRAINTTKGPRVVSARAQPWSEDSQAQGDNDLQPREVQIDDEALDESLAEMLLLVLQSFLERQTAWRLETFQALIRMLFDILRWAPGGRAAVLGALSSALEAAAGRISRLLAEGGPSSDDSLLDVLFHEWELHKQLPANVSEVCGRAHLLLPLGGVHRLSCEADELASRKAARCFLLLRRLLLAFSIAPPGVAPAVTYCEEPSPLVLEEEASSHFRQGLCFEIGRMERIVCSLMTPQGKHTRYLVLHDVWLLIAQPDLSMPGWAVVTTLWPLSQVQPLVDRSEPRTLWVGMHSLGAPPSGGPSGALPAVHSPSSTFMTALHPGAPAAEAPHLTIALCFEDVTRCHRADTHLAKRRRDLRSRLLRRAAAFADACKASQASQEPSRPAGGDEQRQMPPEAPGRPPMNGRAHPQK